MYTSLSLSKPVGSVSIAIGQESGGLHVVLLHNNSKNEWNGVHLAWHYCLKNEPIESFRRYVAFQLRIPQTHQAVVAATARWIAQNNKKGVPYGFGSAGFSGSGVYESRGASGMTCVSFVLAILEQAGVNIVNRDEWNAVPVDSEWISHIIQMMNTISPDDQHVSQLKATSELAHRIRPEHVGAALISKSTYPVPCIICIEGGPAFIELLRKSTVA
jgi:hypothetical protein